MTAYWNTLTLTGDPILVVGLRPKTKIIGYRVTVDRNLHPDLRKIADDALAIVKKRKGIKYTPYVEPGDDEYLELAPSTLTITKTKTNPSGDHEPEATDRPAARDHPPTRCRRSAPGR